jgi:2-polyprenyl-3-methyl-5-hydroxy-6-metoxy-1,4-benzoquinol methylase
MKQDPQCWCGSTDLFPFSPAYLRCQACATLISTCMAETDITRVTNDEEDFYGHTYWFSHQENELGFTSIIDRSRTDLPERCLHWLRAVAKYKLPPARALELGSAHGGFVALLRWTGFEATGLELSPWVVKFAQDTFDVPMLLGPVEDQQIEASSLDLIVLIDVLEHLPDPVGTLQHCLSLLKPDGILVIQTPCSPEEKTYEDLVSHEDPFLGMLVEKEHLYLFSRSSIRKFLAQLGCEFIQFEPAMFARYDMFLIASRSPLEVYTPDQIEKALSTTPNGRMVQALLDLYEKQAELESDRAARLEAVNRLNEQLTVCEADRADRLNAINQLNEQLTVCEADRAARLDQIHTLSRLLQEQVDQVHQLRELLLAISKSSAYKLLHTLRYWKSLDEVVSKKGNG